MKKKDRGLVKRTRRTMAVVVDGDCELWYLQMLKRHEKSIAVNIEPRLRRKQPLHEQFESVKSLAQDFDKVFWIVDLDTILKETKEARKGSVSPLSKFCSYKDQLERQYQNVVVIVNNPCIEFWMLLHFEYTKKIFSNCEAVEQQLKKHLPDYQKTLKYYTKENRDIYLRLKPFQPKGIQHAHRLGPFNKDEARHSKSEMQLFFHAEEFKSLFK